MAVGFNTKMGGLFGNSMPRGRSPYEMPEADMPHAYAQQSQPATNEGGDKTRRIIGIIGDALLGLGGQPGVYGPMMARQRQQDQLFARQQMLAQQTRQAEREDYAWQRDYDLAHPKPANNDTLNDMAAAAQWTPQQWEIYDKLHPIYKMGPDGMPYPVARGGGAVPTAPVGKLTPIDGGPAPQAPGTFLDAFAGYRR